MTGIQEVEYKERLEEFLQDLFPQSTIIHAILRVVIEDDRFVLPEIYIQFEERPRKAEDIVSEYIDEFLQQCASELNVKYTKTLKRIIVEDIQSIMDDLNLSEDPYY